MKKRCLLIVTALLLCATLPAFALMLSDDVGDSLTGVSNAVNGGRVAMGKGTLFFVNKERYLMQSNPPFQRSERAYGAVEYASLDTLNGDIYYFHHYLAERGEKPTTFTVVGRGKFYEPGKPNKYVTRIVRDSINKKGRLTLVNVSERIRSLSVTQNKVLYVLSDSLVSTDIKSTATKEIPIYFQGKQMDVHYVFPYGEYAYFNSKNNGLLYRVPLTGQHAEQISDRKVGAFTIAKMGPEEVLLFSDAKSSLFSWPLDGSSSPALVEGVKASVLNADETYVYFANAADGHKVYRLELETGEATPLSSHAVKSIYVFDDYLAYEQRSDTSLYVMSKGGGQAVLLGR